MPLVLAAGAEEAPGWVAQTEEYAEVCKKAGCKVEFIADDELVEVTPKSIRLRKIYLNENDRKRYGSKN